MRANRCHPHSCWWRGLDAARSVCVIVERVAGLVSFDACLTLVGFTRFGL